MSARDNQLRWSYGTGAWTGAMSEIRDELHHLIDPLPEDEVHLLKLEPLGITQYRLAQATGLPQTRISEIVRGKRAITTGTALRLSKALGVDDRFWIHIQTDDDLEVPQAAITASMAERSTRRSRPEANVGVQGCLRGRPAATD